MRNLYLGDRNVFVQYLQLALTRAGFPTAIDGEFGRDTCVNLREFLQENVGCYVDHRIWDKILPYLRGYTTHIITNGDTVWKLAKRYNTTVSAILTANPGIEEDNLSTGMRIYIPYGFPLVSEEVSYTSMLTNMIVEGLKVRYPFLVTGGIGESVMGKPVSYVQIGNGPKQVFYNASFHANEWITTPVLLKFLEEYADAYANRQSIYSESAFLLYEEYSLYIVPMVNPDGVDLVNNALYNSAYQAKAAKIASDYPSIPFPSGWKANIDGVDLNLQFPAGWEEARRIKYSQGFTTPAPRDYVGDAPLTAIESINIYQFTIEHNFRLILAYHTQGEVIYWKYLDYEPEKSRQIAEYFGNVSGYAVEETPSESGYAGFKDWFIQNYDRPGYTIEAGLGLNPLPMTQFHKIYNDNIYILLGGMTQI